MIRKQVVKFYNYGIKSVGFPVRVDKGTSGLATLCSAKK